MAISAINSINLNKVAFKGAQAEPKKAEAKKDENFFEENKEVIVGLSAIGAAALGAIVLHKTGALGKVADKFSKKADKAAAEAAPNADIIKEKVDVNSREFDKAFGRKALERIEQTINTSRIEKTIAEAGPDGSRHAARIEGKYEEALPEIFKEGAKVNSREDVLTYARVAGLA